MTLKIDHLLGRQFIYGRQDCYALMREFYQDNFGIEMRDYACPDSWHDDGALNLMAENIEDEGFKVVPDFNLRDFRVGDLLLMAMFTPVGSHMAVYIGDGQVLHHMLGRLSEVTPLRGEAINTLIGVYRHPKVQADLGEPPPADIREFMSPMARARLEKRLAAKGL